MRRLRDPLVANALMMVATTLLMAAAGTLFWVIGARIATPTQIGVASSLVAATEALAFFAQVGLNVSLLQSLPASDRPAGDITTAAAIVAAIGAVLALVYAAVVPLVAPDIAHVLTWSLVPLFAVLVAGTALNQLTDSVFLAIDRVRDNLVINGIVLSLARAVLPLTVGAAGAFALFGMVGGTSVLAAVLSLAAIWRRQPDRPRLRMSAALVEARGLAVAGYLVNCLLIAPQLVIPLILVGRMGAARTAVFFVCFQIVNLLNHAVYTVGNAMFAEASRQPAGQPAGRAAVLVRGARTMALAVVGGTGCLAIAAPLLLAAFGGHYADHGATPLRLLALGSVGVALNYWSAMRLRLTASGRTMVIAQLITTTLTLLAIGLGAGHGLAGVALGWGIGQFAGGVVGLVVTLRVPTLPLVASPEVVS